MLDMKIEDILNDVGVMAKYAARLHDKLNNRVAIKYLGETHQKLGLHLDAVKHERDTLDLLDFIVREGLSTQCAIPAGSREVQASNVRAYDKLVAFVCEHTFGTYSVSVLQHGAFKKVPWRAPEVQTRGFGICSDCSADPCPWGDRGVPVGVKTCNDYERPKG